MTRGHNCLPFINFNEELQRNTNVPSDIIDKSFKNPFPHVYLDSSNARNNLTQQVQPLVHKECGIPAQFPVNSSNATAQKRAE